MPCFHPIDAWQTTSGEVVFVERGDLMRQLQLPCGQCIGCRIRRAEEWMTRIVAEATQHEYSIFATLTYDDQHLPPNGSLRYRDVQLFYKRLRKTQKIRHFTVGEYGENLERPHYHAIIFGAWFDDAKPWKTSNKGHPLWVSEKLNQLWGHGLATYGQVTPTTARYCAKYSLKKITGKGAHHAYAAIDPETGEYLPRDPEFARMSTRPAIALDAYRKHGHRWHAVDQIAADGRPIKPPRYFDRILARTDQGADHLEDLKQARLQQARQHQHDQTPERLKAREACAIARSQLTRRALS